MDFDEYDLYTAGAGASLDYMNQLHLQLEEDIYTARDEIPQPSAPLDIAKFKIKVDWTEPFPERWRARLQIALQSWLSRLEGTISVHSIKLMDDPSCAEVQISPSTALKTLGYHRTASLRFKDFKAGKVKGDKEVIAQIYLDEAHVTVPHKSLLEENKAPSLKVNGNKPLTSAVSEDRNNSEDAEITKTFEMTHETSAGVPVPLRHYWYILHVYRKELELIEKQHGVSLEAKLSFKPMKNTSSDSVSKASEDFQKLLSECVDSCSYADINHNDLDSNFVKETFRNIQSEKTKLMFTMSASDCQFFGPKKLTDMIKRERTRSENQIKKEKSNKMDVDGNFSQQRRSSLHMDTKELQTHLEMDKVYWDLMKLSYKDQLSQLETKYGVIFHEDNQQKNVIKVQARSKGLQYSNLESHALRALTNLYQRLASKHLGPAIAHIEKKLKKQMFDDKTKKLIGYSRDIPHARGIRWNQMFDHDPGAVAGAGRGERLDFKKQDETGFSKKI